MGCAKSFKFDKTTWVPFKKVSGSTSRSQTKFLPQHLTWSWVSLIMAVLSYTGPPSLLAKTYPFSRSREALDSIHAQRVPGAIAKRSFTSLDVLEENPLTKPWVSV